MKHIVLPIRGFVRGKLFYCCAERLQRAHEKFVRLGVCLFFGKEAKLLRLRDLPLVGYRSGGAMILLCYRHIAR